MRVRLTGVPPYYGAAQVRDFVAGVLGRPCGDVVVRKAPRWDYALVSFRPALGDAETADAAARLDGAQWKKATVRAAAEEDAGRAPFRPAGDAPRSISDQVAPLWRLPYAAQLAQKHAALCAVLRPWGADALLPPVVASPQTEGYRNKAEFSVGDSPGGAVVGFQMGAFKDGHVSVHAADDVPHVHEALLGVARHVQALLRGDDARVSGLRPYDRVAKAGFWRLVLARVHDGALLVMVQVDPDGLAPGATLSGVEDALRDHFRGYPRLGSLSLQTSSSAHLGVAEAPPRVLLGAPAVAQTLCVGGDAPLRFAVSALSFFQVNVAATERLYALVRDFVLGAASDLVIGSGSAASDPNVSGGGAERSETADPTGANTSAGSEPSAALGEKRQNSAYDDGADGHVEKKRDAVVGQTESGEGSTAAEETESPVEDRKGATTQTADASASEPAAANTQRPVVLDLCCGTGTIGIVLARHAHRVHGVELVSSAVDDARANASLNGAENVSFVCARVEHAISALCSDIDDAADSGAFRRPVVVVLDPPRSGVHASVVRAVRACARVSRVVYVACNAAAAAAANFGDMTRPESRALRGQPFRIRRAAAVDLFPHTPHVELVVCFERESGPSGESAVGQ